MRRRLRMGVMAVAGALTLQAAPAAQQPAALTPLPADLEFALALSALPPHLRAAATVYRLDPDSGFAVARPGTNGLHAFVARQDDTLYRGTWTLTEYRNDFLVPIAFDAAGAEALMPVFFDIAALRAQGLAPAALQRTIRDRFADGTYSPVSRAGVSYMLAPIQRTYRDSTIGDELHTVSLPHYMFYAPGVTDADIGGRPGSPFPFIHAAGPHGYIIQQVGEAERAAILEEHAGMLRRLCAFHARFCL